MAPARQVTGTTFGRSIYPHYDGAELGFREYWYPAVFSHQIRRRPVHIVLCGEEIAFFREGGKVFALADRCPHRGVPLSLGKREFPGTVTCRYHGWTYDLSTGNLLGALTDGPDSPICGASRVCVRTYACCEQAGVVWVYVGDAEPPPLREHVPEEFFDPRNTLVGRITEQAGDWRHAAENGFDEGHPKYLHRRQPFKFFRYAPAWSTVEIVNDGDWLIRKPTQLGYRSDYPGLGPWPEKRAFWKLAEGHKGTPAARIGIRLPGCVRVQFVGYWSHIEWYSPSTVGRYRYCQFVLRRSSPVGRVLFRLWYWLYLRWIYHVDFFNEDNLMIRNMRTPPEQLYRPDISIVAWRRLCERRARGVSTESMPDVATDPIWTVSD